jgi:hypothetical protein
MIRLLLGICFVLCFGFYSEVKSQCVDSTRIQYGAYCDPRWEPVCGCNGYTYRNDCFARNAGLTTWNYTICDPLDFDFNPNPPVDYITVDAWMQVPGTMYVQVVDRFGKIYYNSAFQGTDHYIFQIDFSGYPEGIYYLHCYSDSGSRVKKVLKAYNN